MHSCETDALRWRSVCKHPDWQSDNSVRSVLPGLDLMSSDTPCATSAFTTSSWRCQISERKFPLYPRFNKNLLVVRFPCEAA